MPYIATGRCYACKRVFSFNPDKVPSMVIEGVREPLCRECVERINPMRKEAGTELIYVLPGAYEAGEEE